MKVTGEHSLGKLLKIILQVFFYLVIVIFSVLPFVLNKFGFNLVNSICVIYPNGIVFLVIVYNFIKLFDSLRYNKPFCDENVKILKQTGVVSLISSILWGIDFLYEIFIIHSKNIVFNILLLFICILYFIFSVALYILSELFKQANKYKKENDLTI